MNSPSMKAVFSDPKQNGKNYANDKEMTAAYSIVGKVNGTLQEVVVLRAYMSRATSASVVYASLWVRGNTYIAGHGQAGGYGYHKESAAAEAAIQSAGIELFGNVYSNADEKPNFKKRVSFGGCGTDSMKEALKAIARTAGARGNLLVISH